MEDDGAVAKALSIRTGAHMGFLQPTVVTQIITNTFLYPFIAI